MRRHGYRLPLESTRSVGAVRFVSVNGRSQPVDFTTALLSGLADDGGLYVPEHLPGLPGAWTRATRLAEVGEQVLAPFLESIPRDTLREIIEKAWDFPLPLRTLDDDIHLLELFHGPTLAFKDFGARLMAGVLSHLLEQDERKVTVLVATSGDTGSAVAHGFWNADRIKVFVLYPSGRVSPLQEAQMTTLGGNVHAMEVDGTFDDCQALVKQALTDPQVHSALTLTTANSINPGRLLPQIVFYAWGVIQQTAGDPRIPRAVVPSGNFGNLTAALYAKTMGVPLGRLVAATNANDEVPEYLRTGTFTPAASIPTLSSAMDVGDPSNLARIQHLYDGHVDRIRADVEGVSVSDEETLDEIRNTRNRTGIVIDPHTAVGVRAARRLRSAGETAPFLVAATAHPGKFPDTIERALGEGIPVPESLSKALGKPKQSTPIKADYETWKKLLLADPD